jgi:hypothetical protein
MVKHFNTKDMSNTEPKILFEGLCLVFGGVNALPVDTNKLDSGIYVGRPSLYKTGTNIEDLADIMKHYANASDEFIDNLKRCELLPVKLIMAMNTDTPQVEQWLKDLAEAQLPYRAGVSEDEVNWWRMVFISGVQWAMANREKWSNEINRCPYCGTIIAQGEVICGECACENDDPLNS